MANGILQLVSTAIEGLAFVELVATRAEALSFAACPPEVLVRFSELSFRDLVCQPEARHVLQQLMRGGVVACRQLHASCPSLFNEMDVELQEAYDLLAVVHSSLSTACGTGIAPDHLRLCALVQRALRAFERNAQRVDLNEATLKLREVGAYKGVIGLCAKISRVRDPQDVAMRLVDPTDARSQQLQYARLEPFQVMLEVFEELLNRVRQHQALVGSTPAMLTLSDDGIGLGGTAAGNQPDLAELYAVPMNAASALPVLDAMLRHCLEGQNYFADELMHFCILRWMLERGLPLYKYNSVFLRGFLEKHAADQPELLCRYYQHRGQWSDACDAYMTLALGDAGVLRGAAQRRPSPQEQLVLLQKALLCAQMPGSNRRPEPIRQAISGIADGRLRSIGGLGAQDHMTGASSEILLPARSFQGPPLSGGLTRSPTPPRTPL